MTKESEDVADAIWSSQDLVRKVRKIFRYVRWGLRGDGFKGGKHDPTMSRRRGDVQRMDKEMTTGL